MSTPCILAFGTAASWVGVPCKMNGDPASTGPVVLDAMLRLGVEGAGEKLVLGAPFGWAWAGGPALDEVDEYLAGERLTSSTEHLVSDRHYARYLIDRERGCLDITVFPELDAPLAPVVLTAAGRLASLPDWYPRPNPSAETRPHSTSATSMPRIERLCGEHRLRWPILKGALRDWCLRMLGDLSGVSWLLAGGGDDDAYTGGRVGETMVHVSSGAGTATFFGSDGKLRAIDIDDTVLAAKIIEALARSPRHQGEIGRMGMPLPRHTELAIEAVLTSAYSEGTDDALAHVAWMAGAKEWGFFAASSRAPGATERERYPQGWLAPLVSWLLL